MTVTLELHNKYRPTDFKDVCGQAEAVKSLKGVLKAGSSHSFIFVGPSGVGKTTLARIVASQVGCSPSNVREIDAATHTGIDAMRAITETLQYTGLGSSPQRVLIVDEAHALSTQAWQSLLKGVEEPPKHVYWCFCTTNPEKIPQTIKTRCVVYSLKPVPARDIEGILMDVKKAEGMKVSDEVIDYIASISEGSPRRALTFLAQCPDLTSRKEAAALLRQANESGDIIELCRYLTKSGTSWSGAMKLVEKIKDQDPEGCRRVICAYFTKVAMGAQTAGGAATALAVLEAFSTPYPSNTGIYPLLLSIGELIFGAE